MVANCTTFDVLTMHPHGLPTRRSGCFRVAIGMRRRRTRPVAPMAHHRLSTARLASLHGDLVPIGPCLLQQSLRGTQLLKSLILAEKAGIKQQH